LKIASFLGSCELAVAQPTGVKDDVCDKRDELIRASYPFRVAFGWIVALLRGMDASPLNLKECFYAGEVVDGKHLCNLSTGDAVAAAQKS
jgi:hypothetical protein